MLRTLGPNGERREEEPETRMQEPAAPKPKMTKRQSTVEYKVEPCKLQLLRSLGEYDEPVRLGTIISKLNLLAFSPRVLQPRIDYLRSIGVKKVGHSGTLDPFASGVLVVCIGRPATRLIPWLQREGDKEYEAEGPPH